MMPPQGGIFCEEHGIIPKWRLKTMTEIFHNIADLIEIVLLVLITYGIYKK